MVASFPTPKQQCFHTCTTVLEYRQGQEHVALYQLRARNHCNSSRAREQAQHASNPSIHATG